MKHTSRLCLLVSLVLTLVLALSLVSCGEPDPTPTCTHTYGAWEVTKAPTCEAEGTQTQVCSLCGDTKTESVAPTGHTDTLLCRDCDKELVALESLIPEALPTDEYTVTLKDIALEGMVIEELVLHYYITADGMPFAHGTATVESDGTDMPMSLFVENGNVYVLASTEEDGYEITVCVGMFIEELIGSMMGDPSAFLDPEQSAALAEYMATLEALAAWFEEYIAPSLGDAELPPVTEPAPPAIDEESARALLETFFTVKHTADGSTLTLDLDALKEYNEALSEMTVAEFVDFTVGEGTFQSITSTVPMLLAFSVEDALTLLSQEGITLTDYEAEIDALLAATVGEGATVEAMFGAPLSVLLTDETVLATTVSDLICTALSTESAPVTEAEVLYEINSYLGMLEVAKLYSMLASPDTPDLKDAVDALIDSLDDTVSLVITADKDGAYGSTKLTFDLGIAKMTAELLNDRMELTLKSGFDKMTATVTYTPDKTPDLDALAAAKDGIVYLPIDEDTLAENGFEAIYADDGETVIGATYSELTDDLGYIDEEYGYACYGVYTVDLTAAPFLVSSTTVAGVTVATYGFPATYTLYEFEFTPGESFTFDGAVPTAVTPSTESVTLTVTALPAGYPV